MENIIKIFISLPMHGKTTNEIRKRMENIRKGLQSCCDLKIEIVNNDVERTEIPKGSPRLAYLGRAIMDLSKADVVVFDYDFREANGCRIEKKCCDEYNIPYVYIRKYLCDDVRYLKTYGDMFNRLKTEGVWEGA